MVKPRYSQGDFIVLKLKWTPQPDITAFELAQCMSVLIASLAKYSGNEQATREFEKLPTEAKRHFVVLENSN